MQTEPNAFTPDRGEGGTYVLSQFKAQEKELDRLRKQASVVPHLERKVLEQNGLEAGMHVLDAACGPGIVSGLLYRIVTQSCASGSVTGIDLDPELLQLAHEQAQSRQEEIHFLEGNVYELPFIAQFDYAYCRFLFQHLNCPATALRALSRSLKPGGKIHILDVNDDWLFLEPTNDPFQELCHLANHYQDRMGGNRRIGRQLRNLLQDTGFTSIQTDVVMIHSDMVGLSTFLELTTLFKLEIVERENPPKAQALRRALQVDTLSPNTFGACGLFSVTAVKPH